MITAHNLVHDGYIPDLVTTRFRNKEIVNAPPRVPFAGLEHIGPPGIGPFPIRIEHTEGVNESPGKERIKLLPLLVRKAGIVMIGIRVLEVDGFMGHIHVPADDGYFLL